MGTGKYNVYGKLEKTSSGKLYANVYRVGQRRKYIDEKGQIFLKVSNKWWKFPEEIEH